MFKQKNSNISKLNFMHFFDYSFYSIIWTFKNSSEPWEDWINCSVSTFLPPNATMICKRNTKFNRIYCMFAHSKIWTSPWIEENGINATCNRKRYDMLIRCRSWKPIFTNQTQWILLIRLMQELNLLVYVSVGATMSVNSADQSGGSYRIAY